MYYALRNTRDARVTTAVWLVRRRNVVCGGIAYGGERPGFDERRGGGARCVACAQVRAPPPPPTTVRMIFVPSAGGGDGDARHRRSGQYKKKKTQRKRGCRASPSIRRPPSAITEYFLYFFSLSPPPLSLFTFSSLPPHSLPYDHFSTAAGNGVPRCEPLRRRGQPPPPPPTRTPTGRGTRPRDRCTPPALFAARHGGVRCGAARFPGAAPAISTGDGYLFIYFFRYSPQITYAREFFYNPKAIRNSGGLNSKRYRYNVRTCCLIFLLCVREFHHCVKKY